MAEDRRVILAGDVGGTNTRLAFFELVGGRPKPIVEATFPSREFLGLDEIVERFVATHHLPVESGAFGVAGVVKGGRCETINLPWVVDSTQLASRLGLGSVGLINDLEANAYGVAVLEERDFSILNQGESSAAGNAAVISAGTGLGEAGMYWDGSKHCPFATEGGHSDFAPRNELEVEVQKYLRTHFGHVSWERVLSGPGLFNIYKFLRDTGHGEEPGWLAEEMRERDASAVISQAAMEGRSGLCEQALDLFVSLYGAEAGNLALKVMALGGVYVGGGIAPKIIQKLRTPAFMESFAGKGRLKPLLEAMPVRVILNDKTALLGAVRYAALHLATS